MKTITNYIDDLKIKTGSDYKTAQLLELDRSAITWIRKKKTVGEETAVKMAKILEVPEEEILIAAAISRSEGETKLAWERVSQRMSFLSVILVINQVVEYVKNTCELYIMLKLKKNNRKVKKNQLSFNV